MELAAHMGAEFPAKLKLAGTMDGALVYSGDGKLQGAMAFHDTAVTIPDSPPVRFEQAYIVFDNGHARLTPALVRTSEQDQAQIEADYAMERNTLDLSIHSDAMQVASLRAQVALAAVPWLEQIKTGQWSGDLHYHYEPPKAGWTGQARDPGCAEWPCRALPSRSNSRRRGRKSMALAWSWTRSTPQAGKVAFHRRISIRAGRGAAASRPPAGRRSSTPPTWKRC